MYSPKINEAYIPVIYRMAKSKGMRMTTLVNEIIGSAISVGTKEVDNYDAERGTK